jgi:hypothetical protein
MAAATRASGRAMPTKWQGEHGIGDGKQQYLAAELDLPAVQAMHSIKQALDPSGIMNPGKIFGGSATPAAGDDVKASSDLECDIETDPGVGRI